MILTINKKEITGLETNGVCHDLYEMDPKLNTINIANPINVLNFEGFSAFNSKYIVFILNLLAKNVNFFYNYIITLDTPDNETGSYISIQNTRDTSLFFDNLKRFGLTFTSLNIFVVPHKDGTKTLYLSSRLAALLSRIESKIAMQLCYYFLLIHSVLSAFAEKNVKVYTNGTKLGIDKAALDTVTKACNDDIKDGCTIEVKSYSGTFNFKSITYVNNDVTKLNPIKTATSSRFKYNTYTTKTGKSSLILTDVTTADIMPVKNIYIFADNIIFTNSELMDATCNSQDSLLQNIINIYLKGHPEFHYFMVRQVDLGKTFTADKVHNLNPEATEYTDFLNELCNNKYNIEENYDANIFKTELPGVTFKIMGGIADIKDDYASDPFAQECYKNMPAYLNTVDLKELAPLVKGLITGTCYSMLFYGEAGTSKSTMVKALAVKSGIPYVSMNASINCEETDLIGTFIPNPDKTASNPFIWQDGILTKAVRNGYIFNLEEITFARPGVLGKLNSLLDESRVLELPNGEIVHAHKNFKFFATCNIAYEGTNRLNKALIDRFQIVREFTELSNKDITNIIMTRTGYTDVSKINKILNVYNSIKKYSSETSLHLTVSVRRVLDIFTIGKYYKSAKEAVLNCLVSHAFIEESEHLENYKNTILPAFDADLAFKI